LVILKHIYYVFVNVISLVRYFSGDENCANGASETTKDPEQQDSKDKLIVRTISIVCSCGKDPTTTSGQKCQSFGHTATLVVALSVTKEHSTAGNSAEIDKKDETCSTVESQICPYILVYDILTENNETTAKPPLYNVDSSIELEKEMLLQDPYTPSGSEDDWMYEQLPVLPPDTLHSSVLQKFAEAIASEENSDKEKVKKSKEDAIKSKKLVQSVEASGVCKGQHCKISELVPFRDGQNLLVNFVCCSSCDNKMELETSDSKHVNGETVQVSADFSVASGSNSVQGNHHNSPNHEHKFTRSTLAVYRIFSSNGERTLSPQPARTKHFSVSDGILSSIVALPVESHDLLGDTTVHFQEPETELSSPSQLLVGAANGSVLVIDANPLNVLTKFTTSNESSHITHILNCPGIDCFCTCTEDGMMRFLGLRKQLSDEMNLSVAGQDRADGIPDAPSRGIWTQSGTIETVAF